MKKTFAKIFGAFKNPQFRRAFIIGSLLIVLIAGGFVYLMRKDKVYIDNSLIQAPIINITSQTPGNLNQINVADDQTVKNGDLLAVVGTQSLRAQTDGIIIQASKQIGSLVSAQTNVVSMVNQNDFRVVGTIDETKGLKDLHVGQIASFTVDAYPDKTFWGFVDEISPSAKQTQLSFSISSERPVQQFLVYTRFDAFKYPEIKNGMSAKMTVFTKTH